MSTMVRSRPDLAHALSKVSQYMNNPSRSHWDATKWILRYLKGISSKGLVYTKMDQFVNCIVGFV